MRRKSDRPAMRDFLTAGEDRVAPSDGAGQVFRVEKGSRRSAGMQARDQAGVTRDMRHVPGRGVI
ncbi:hypothetical protein NBRC3293_0372 [Gluconobacter oxydans NBRC 3293]|uniref:Uncharacterized protein n=1 Tax=Gluconobacter oxydans NBRC 3293 TaxID=1315969 RepID=A0A829X5N7_GLUOY|nr:hypothetical protein NBRC3293_0372 [Gluconobacter oxydans NBRC 3293]